MPKQRPFSRAYSSGVKGRQLPRGVGLGRGENELESDDGNKADMANDAETKANEEQCEVQRKDYDARTHLQVSIRAQTPHNDFLTFFILCHQLSPQTVLDRAFTTAKVQMKKETRIAAKREPLVGAYRRELKSTLAASASSIGPLVLDDIQAEPGRFEALRCVMAGK